MYNFKSIQVVPPAKEFVDIVLTRTQRKTPTVVHPGFALSRIRSFYMRKVKFTQDTINEKLSKILDDFPKVDEVHPFYSDLMNVLYDRDHYKIALGQINVARNLVDTLAKDYIRLLKLSDSLFKAKQLKRAALGRMCKVLLRQAPNLAYLEDVRKHLSRIPSINPSTRTLIITGYPNVGKSSFMNKVTRADVDVQEYAFTTKSLFVGHFDFRYIRWQVIDSPGILDHPLEARNTIEMQSITALAHLRAAVLYFIDISTRCGYTIEQQISLFNNIKPLFSGKPLIVVATKVDIQPWSELDKKYQDAINSMVKEAGATFVTMSNFTDEGIAEVKNRACTELLAMRVEEKASSRKIGDIMTRLNPVIPKPRDSTVRAANIPEGVLRARAAKAAKARAAAEAKDFEDDPDRMDAADAPKRVLEKDKERAAGGPGRYHYELSTHHLLADDTWKSDVMPEFMDGKNVSDFLDPKILARMEELEKEEEVMLQRILDADEGDVIESSEDEMTKRVADAIRYRKVMVVGRRKVEHGKNRSKVARNKRVAGKAAELAAQLDKAGLPTDAVTDGAMRTKRRGRSLTRRGDGDEDDMEVGGGGGGGARSVSKSRERPARGRSASRGPFSPPMEGEGFKDLSQKVDAYKIMKKRQKRMAQEGRKGGGDRFIGTKMPQHLFSGKRGFQTDRR